MGIIYRAENKRNGKCWVGQTRCSLRVRRKFHENAARRGVVHPFYNAVRKYGTESFRWFVVYKAIPDELLDEMEARAIRNFNTTVPSGYNVRPGGKTTRGWKHSEEAKQKCSTKNKGKKRTEEVKRQRSESQKRKWKDPDYKQKQKASLSGRKMPPVSDETRERMREAWKKRKERQKT